MFSLFSRLIGRPLVLFRTGLALCAISIVVAMVVVGSVSVVGVSDSSVIINITQNKGSIDAQVVTNRVIIDNASWQSFKTSDSTEPNCDANDNYGPASSSANSIAVLSSDHDKWACFRVKKTRNTPPSYVYAKKQIKITPTSGLAVGNQIATITTSTISFSQTNQALTASLAGADASTWKNNYDTATTSNSTCDSTTTFGSASNTANSVGISWDDNGKWICFTVTNSGSSVYGKHQVDLGPIITVTQKDDTGEVLTASSSATDLPTNPVWQHSGPFSAEQDCTSGTITWFNGNKIKYIDYKQYYCFKVADTSGNTGYARFKTKSGPVRLGWRWPKLPDKHPVGGKQKILAQAVDIIPELKSNDEFGSSLSVDGDRLVVGSPNYTVGSNSKIGSVYIYKKDSTGGWNLEDHIVDKGNTTSNWRFNYLQAGDQFGQAVAIDGDRIAVGAPGDDGDSGGNTGAVYIFRRFATTGWVIEHEIVDTKFNFTRLESGDKFGGSLALSGNRLAVGASGDDVTGKDDAGAVYIFRLVDSTWELEQEISDGNNGFTSLSAGDKFGTTVALDGRWLAVGAIDDDGTTRDDTGAVYTFQRSRTIWDFKQKISDESTDFKSLEAGDQFGSALSLEGRTLVVGADQTTRSSIRSGAAYIFTKGLYNDIWSFQQEISRGNSGLAATTIKAGDQFGVSVSLSGSRLAIGASGTDTTGMTDTGAVYTFKKSGSSWTLEQELSYDVGSLNFLRQADALGATVALEGDWLVTGAPMDDGVIVASNSKTKGTNTGTVYVFKKDNNVWVDHAQLRNTRAEVKTDSWQHSSSLADADASTCDSSVTFDTAGANEYEFIANPNNNDKWVCFRVLAKDTDDVYSYLGYQFDFAGPTFPEKMMVGVDTLAVTVADESLRGNGRWSPGIPAVNPNCSALGSSETRTFWRFTSIVLGDTKKYHNAYYGAKYCNRKGDNGDNSARVRVQASLPIAVSQTATTVTASTPERVNPDLSEKDEFGNSVSLDGDWMAVGAHKTDSTGANDSGAVYIFKKNASNVWVLKGKLDGDNIGSHSLAANDQFGYSVSLNGGRLAVGAPFDDVTVGGNTKNNTGAVYIFKKIEGDTWSFEDAVDATDLTEISAGAEFGFSVSLNGDYLAVGAPGNKFVDCDENTGPHGYGNDEVYIFKRETGNNWNKKQKINRSSVVTSLDIENHTAGQSAALGNAVSLDGDRLVIGVSNYDLSNYPSHPICQKEANEAGAIVIFNRTGESWSLEHTFTATTATGSPIKEGDNLGTSVSLNGNYLVAGAPGDNAGTSNGNYGAVHILKRTNSGWGDRFEINRNSVSDLSTTSGFGTAVSLDGDRLVVGAPKHDPTRGATKLNNPGAVYIFSRTSGNTWSLEKQLSANLTGNILVDAASDNYAWEANAFFGGSVAVDGDHFAAGAVGDEGAAYSDGTRNKIGAVQALYKKPDQGWLFGSKLRDNPARLSTTNPWGYFKSTTTTKPTNCNSNGTFTDSSSAPSVSIASTDVGKWICFRVKIPALSGSGDFISYRLYEIVDLTPPTVNVFQVGNLIVATSPGLNEESFEYFTSSSNPDCTSSNTTATYTVNNFTGNMTAGQWVCFKVRGSNGVDRYTEAQIDKTPPEITVHKFGTMIMATSSATDLPTTPIWQKKKLANSSSVCNATTSGFSGGNFFDGIASSDNYCFKIADKNNNFGYKRITIDRNYSISITQSRGNTDKVLAGVNTNYTGTITTDSWQNFKTSDTSEPNCNLDDTFGSASATADTVIVTSSGGSSDKNKWVCFRVKNNNNVYIYQKQQIDYDAPVVNIARSGSTITASSDATDLPNNPVWKYADPKSSSDCDSSTTGFTTSNSFIVSNSDLQKYICFKVADKNGNDGFGEYLITNDPIISIDRQTQVKVYARATTHSSDGLDSSSWENYTSAIAIEPDCDEDDTFVNSGATAKTATITNTTTSATKWVCFRVKNNNDNSEYGYKLYRVDYTAPVIEVSEIETTMVAHTTATDLPTSSTWRKKMLQDSTSDCDSNTTGFAPGNSFNGVLSSSYYCFKVTDKSGNSGYKKVQGGEAPDIVITQNSDNVTASASTGDSSSWQNLTTSSLLQPACDQSETTFSVESTANSIIGISSSDNNSWVCFRVKNSNGVYGYAKYQIDFNNPIVDISQVGTTITAHTNDLNRPDSSGWQKKGPYYPPQNLLSHCDSNTTGFTSGNSFTNVVTSAHYCFKVTDKAGNVGYGKIQIGEAPVVTIAQTSNRAEASATTTGVLINVSWQNFKTADATKPCDFSSTLFGPASSGANRITVNASDNNSWVCFRVKNSNNIYGYHRHRISNAFNPPSTPNQPPDTPTTVILLTPSGDSIVASGDGLSNFQYFITSNEPDCSDNNKNVVYQPGKIATKLQPNSWVCFRAWSNTGQFFSYAKRQMVGVLDDSALTALILTPVGDKIVASGTNLTNFQHFIFWSWTSPDCSDDNKEAVYNVSSVAVNLRAGDWVCFRAINATGVFVYALVQFQPVTVVDQPSPGSSDLIITPIVGGVRATGVNLTNYQYFISRSRPDCSNTNQAATFVIGQTVTNLDTDSWVCFRAINATGVFVYALVKFQPMTVVDQPIPGSSDLIITPIVGGVRATGVNLTNYQYFISRSRPDCSNTNQAATFVIGQTVTNLDTDSWVCFRAINATGVFVYALVQFQPVTVVDQPIPGSSDLIITPIVGGVRATGVNLTNYQYFISRSRPDCSNTNQAATFVIGQTVTNLDTDSWVCFRAINATGVFVYALVKFQPMTVVDQPIPGSSDLIITPIVGGVRATGVNLTNYQYFISRSRPDCSNTNQAATFVIGQTVTNLDTDSWVCFRAINATGVFVYALVKFQPMTVVDQPIPGSSDLIITPIVGGVRATGVNLTNYQYFISRSRPDCSNTNQAATFVIGQTVTNLDTDSWVCFRAINATGVFVYALVQFQPMTVVDQPIPGSSDLIITPIVGGVRATGVNLTNYQYFISRSRPDCSNTNQAATFVIGQTVTNLDTDSWVCFRAINATGVFVYALVKFQPMTVVDQPIPGSSDLIITPIVGGVRATGVNLTNYQYFISRSRPDCSNTNQAATFVIGQTVTNLDTDSWVCFRAINATGVFVYALVQFQPVTVVDQPIPGSSDLPYLQYF